jgi:hypothetical protein
MAASFSAFSLNRPGLGLRLRAACVWLRLSRSVAKPSQTRSRAALSPGEKGRKGRFEGFESEEEPARVAAESGSSMGMCEA